MKKNLGTIDRLVRTALALTFAALIYTGDISGAAAVMLGTLGTIFVLTSTTSFCPLYVPFTVSTVKGSGQHHTSEHA